jgi:hypothetical protein
MTSPGRGGVATGGATTAAAPSGAGARASSAPCSLGDGGRGARPSSALGSRRSLRSVAADLSLRASSHATLRSRGLGTTSRLQALRGASTPPYLRETRGRDDRREPGHELHARHPPELALASAIDVLEVVRYAASGQTAQPFERQGWPRAVSREPLSAEVVSGCDAHAGMHVEPVALDREHGLVGARALFGVTMCVVLLTVARQRRDRAAAHRDGGAGVEGCLRWRFVGACFERRVVEVATLAQPPHRPARRTFDDRIEIGGPRRGRRMAAVGNGGRHRGCGRVVHSRGVATSHTNTARRFGSNGWRRGACSPLASNPFGFSDASSCHPHVGLAP